MTALKWRRIVLVRTVAFASVLAATLPILASDISHPPSVVFDNSATPLNQNYGVNGVQFGDEVMLAGTNRTVVSFKFEYTLGWSASGNETLQLWFFANDGALIARTLSDGTVTHVPAPDTLLYASPSVHLFPGYNVIELAHASIPVPDTFTWAVRFEGLEPGEDGGLPLYSPPTVGASADDFWQRSDEVWELRSVPNATPAGNFAAIISAISVPAIAIDRGPQGEAVVLVPSLSSPQVLQRSSSLRGPWTDWQTVPGSSSVGTTVTYPLNRDDDRTFFRLRN